jgi:GNAT superfamily N-acetyltransferase
MSFRDAIASDLPAIDGVFRQTFCDTFAHLYRAEDLAAFLAKFTPQAWADEFADPDYRFRVAEEDGEVVGYVKLGPSALPVDTDKRAIELRQLYVLRDHHGTGVAATLTEWAIEQARRLGFEELYLTVYVDNPRARRFYDRYGFEAVARYAFMVGSHPDEDLIMRKVL